MLIRRFEVQGFRNLTEPVVLEGLGPLNMIHGENNVGKSNLLRAMEMFFRLLAIDDWWAASAPMPMTDEEFELRVGQRRVDTFNLTSPKPIRLAATLEIEHADLVSAGIEPLVPSERIEVAMELVWLGTKVQHRITRFRFPNGEDGTSLSGEANTYAFKLAVALGKRGASFRRVKAKRTDALSLAALAQSLYEARDAVELPRVQQWDRFETAMESFADVLGPGRFSPRRPQDQYVLAFRTDTAMIPVHLLGSGVQQLVAMLGAVLVPGAQIVAIEEPELHLKTTLQERLRDLLCTLPGSVGAPSQIFLTSHSPHFEVSDSFYFLSRKDAQSAPTVEKRPASAAPLAVGAHVPKRHEGKFPTSWVSHEGVVRLAPRVMEHLGIVGGGAVVVEPAAEQGLATIEGEDRYLDRVGIHDEEA